jgi:type I restriction-modification system DNA methylase subunit
MTNNTFDVKTLETWLWEAACKIRGEIDAPKYKDYILPLIFLKRLSDVFDDEIIRLSEEYGERKTAEELVEEDHSLVWFYVPKHARWTEILKQSAKQGEFLTDAVRAIARDKANSMKKILETYPYWKTSEEHERKFKQEILKVFTKSQIEPKKAVELTNKIVKMLKGAEE